MAIVNEGVVLSKEHQLNQIKQGICPLCSSTEGFEDHIFSKGTEFEIQGSYCKSCMIKII